MKRNVLLATASVIVTVLFALTPTAHAGRSGRDVTKGALIGAGVAVLGTQLMNARIDHQVRKLGAELEFSNHGHRHRKDRHGRCGHRDHYRKGRHHRPSGYWVIEKIWVPNPYKYRHGKKYRGWDRRDRYRHGRHDSKGHWIKQKVWVSY